MTVEAAYFISDLNDAFPRARDLINEGDDHIRMTKKVLQNTFPGMDKAITITADKLNAFDAAIDLEEGALVVDAGFKITGTREVDMGKNPITGLGDPKEDTDAVNLRSVRNAAWPIGSIYLTVDSRNPSVTLGFGTWEEFAAGRVIIGTGSGTDSNSEVKTFLNEAKGGEYAHKITVDELPNHTHGGGNLVANTAGEHTHTFQQLQIAKPSPDTKHNANIAQYNMTTYTTDAAGAHTHTIGGTSAETGKGVRASVMQPWIGVNIWKRTA